MTFFWRVAPNIPSGLLPIHGPYLWDYGFTPPVCCVLRKVFSFTIGMYLYAYAGALRISLDTYALPPTLSQTALSRLQTHSTGIRPTAFPRRATQNAGVFM